MCAEPLPGAGAITVLETLEFLRRNLPGLADGVGYGEYALWLGSGVSRDKVEDLEKVVTRALTFLHGRSNFDDPGCTHRRALEEVIDLVEMGPAKRAEIDARTPIGEWPGIAAIVARLVDRYSAVLDVRVAGEGPDYLLWEGMDFPRTFGTSRAPDSEHLCLAILGLEGVTPEVVSANWDDLIEAAVEELVDEPEGVLRVVVDPRELREGPRRTRLVKLHGCARKATRDESRYRRYLVARESQITDWRDNPDYDAVRASLESVATCKPTLMIGLSAQDKNIQGVFTKAKRNQPWPWVAKKPAHVFAGRGLSSHHKTILRCVYREQYEADGQAVESTALVPAYAKPLLTALTLHVIGAKLVALVRVAVGGGLAEAEHEELAIALVTLRDAIADRARQGDEAAVRAAVKWHSRVTSVFYEGKVEREGRPPRYRPLTPTPVDQVPSVPSVRSGGAPEAATALALLAAGQSRGIWRLSVEGADEAAGAPLRVEVAGAPARPTFLVGPGSAYIELDRSGAVEAGGPGVLVLHTAFVPDPSPRSPRARYGRDGTTRPQRVSMLDVVAGSSSVDEMMGRFRREAVL